MARKPLLEMENISRVFPGIRANDGICLQLFSGEVLALLGENGAGKTTLMNILFGMYQPSSGSIRLRGKSPGRLSPTKALQMGIGMVQQHFSLVPSFSVAENITLGWKTRSNREMLRGVERKIQQLGAHFGLPVDPRAKVWTLSVGEKQRVEILKLLFTGAQILVLDEPTAVLTPGESQQLLAAIRKMVRQGSGVIFISHKLEEVLSISDRIVVLRHGKVVGTVDRSEADETTLVKMMMGHEPEPLALLPSPPRGLPRLEVKGLQVKNDRGHLAIRNLSLEVQRGEILGLAGVSGNGQRELAQALYGLRRVVSGSISLDGISLESGNVHQRILHRFSYIPADRKGVASCPNLSVRENLSLKKRLPPVRNGKQNPLIRTFSIQVASEKMPVRLLSGGNLQKVIVARELSAKPTFILADNPTWGLDIQTTGLVSRILREEAKRGTAILLISSDLEELFRLSDRIAVLFEGSIMGYAPPDRTYREKIGRMMAGIQGESGEDA
ncbi:MAG TPA: ABC transporter ATP-binding protein [Thermotogota bacterium]|nr:ABC transporter ATP-binding protein [Thermotogota bacterium]HRW93475.1 ABC transporter ATP-binding protein [Thermotogota bacterium]